MIEESQVNQNNFANYGQKLLGYMHRNSKISQDTKLLPSWFINEVNVEISDINNYLGYIFKIMNEF